MSSVVRYSAHLRSPVNHILSFWNSIYPGVDGGVGMSQSQPIDESRYQKDNVHVSVPLSLLGHEPDNPTGLYLSKPSMVRLKSQGHVLEEYPNPKSPAMIIGRGSSAPFAGLSGSPGDGWTLEHQLTDK